MHARIRRGDMDFPRQLGYPDGERLGDASAEAFTREEAGEGAGIIFRC